MPAAKNTTQVIAGIAIAFGVMMLVCCGGGVWFARNIHHQFAGTAELPAGVSYAEWRDSFQSDLVRKGPAPQGYDQEPLPANVSEVTYASGDLQLRGWVFRPPEATADQPAPALLFLHGGFAFGMGDLMACQPAMDRGYVVMAPALRGENGNPGHFEMMLGEVDDAKAAAQWLADQAYVDPNRIYVFGHSVGGGISAMLPLLDDVPIQHSGSSGGLYPPTVFLGWMDDVPFKNGPEERMARLLIGNIEQMQLSHYAYIGDSDSLHDAVGMARQEAGANSRLTIEMVPGDHFTSFEEALERYLQRCGASHTPR